MVLRKILQNLVNCTEIFSKNIAECLFLGYLKREILLTHLNKIT